MRLLLVAFLLLSSSAGRADEYVEALADQTSRTDIERRQTVMSVAVQGPIYPSKAFDPACNERIECNCRRLCADLPPGKKFVSIASEAIRPPEYARFVDAADGKPVEIHETGDHQRVCRLLKVWRPLLWLEFTVTLNWK